MPTLQLKFTAVRFLFDCSCSLLWAITGKSAWNAKISKAAVLPWNLHRTVCWHYDILSVKTLMLHYGSMESIHCSSCTVDYSRMQDIHVRKRVGYAFIVSLQCAYVGSTVDIQGVYVRSWGAKEDVILLYWCTHLSKTRQNFPRKPLFCSNLLHY